MELMMVGWVGIDPGATGAIAAVREDGQAQVWDWPGDECKLVGVFDELLRFCAPAMCVIEQQQAMPKQGVVSTFKLGQNFGLWLSALAFSGLPYVCIRPADWKRNLGYPAGKKESKAHSLTIARRMYPGVNGMLEHVKDHGRAEALIMAGMAKERSR